MPKRVVEVFLGDDAVPVGTAFFHGFGARLRTTFTYSPEWLRSRDAFPLAPDAPLNVPSFQCAGLPGFLSDAAPDRWGRHLIFRGAQGEAELHGLGMRSLDDVDFLLGVDDWARMGALRLSHDGGASFAGAGTDVPKIVRLPELMSAARDVDAGSDGWAQLKSLLDVGSSSLGGARPKATVEDAGELWLAKFSSVHDEWDVIAWESWALVLAHRCAIITPSHRLERVGTHAVLLSRRFDRCDARRIPYMSALTALGLRDGDLADYLDLADMLQALSGQPESDLEELFRRMVLSVLIHNTDDHLRNHGFLHSETGWSLSPVFDINPNPFGNERRTLLIMGASDVGDEVEALRSFAEAIDLAPQRAHAIAQEVLRAARDWQSLAQRAGCTQREIGLFSPMIEGRREALSALLA